MGDAEGTASTNGAPSTFIRSVVRSIGDKAKRNIPLITIEVPNSIKKIQGYVAAGQMFWRTESKWNVSRCLLCVKEDDLLEVMLCDSKRNVPPGTEDVYITPSRVLKKLKKGTKENDNNPVSAIKEEDNIRAINLFIKNNIKFGMSSEAASLDVKHCQSALKTLASISAKDIIRLKQAHPNLEKILKAACINFAGDSGLMPQPSQTCRKRRSQAIEPKRKQQAVGSSMPKMQIEMDAEEEKIELSVRDKKLELSCPDPKRPKWRTAVPPENETMRLKFLRSLNILDSPNEAVFDNILWLATNTCEAEMGAISLIDSNRQWFKARRGLTISTSRDMAFCSHAILQPGKLTLVTDAQNDDRFAENPLVTGAPNIRFYAGVPIAIDVGVNSLCVGTLCVISSKPKTLSIKQQGALRHLAHLVKGVLLERVGENSEIRQLEGKSKPMVLEKRSPSRKKSRKEKHSQSEHSSSGTIEGVAESLLKMSANPVDEKINSK